MKLYSNNKTLPLIIWGASGHARVVADVVRLMGKFNIIGFLDNVDLDRKGTEFCGSLILGGAEQLEHLRNNNIRYMIFGFGDCQARLTLSSFANRFGFDLATVVHPSAVVAGDVVIGAGTVIMAGVVINPATVVQENVIINTSASVDHDCIIMKGAHIGPGVRIGGGVIIGQGTWIGIGAIIKDKIRIGNNTIVGAGAVVLKDIPDGVVAFGTPAKIIRSVE